MRRLALILITLITLWGCSTQDPTPPASTSHPYNRVIKAWEQVGKTYPETREFHIDFVLEVSRDPARYIAYTPWDGNSIHLDPNYINKIDDIRLEALLVHEFWHVWDIKRNKMTYSQLRLMEQRASEAQAAYIINSINKRK